MGKPVKTSNEPFLIVIPIYDGVDLMDIAAPREIFGWLASDESFQRKVKNDREHTSYIYITF